VISAASQAEVRMRFPQRGGERTHVRVLAREREGLALDLGNEIELFAGRA
jgi:hypothetical protein